MKVLVRNHGEGGATVEVIDPSDGACTHNANISDGEQITVIATTATSPADIEFGEVEAIPLVPESTEDAEDRAANQVGGPQGNAEDTVGDNGEESDEQGTDPEDQAA